MKKKVATMTPVRAIHAWCIRCTSSQKGPGRCTETGCPLYPYRMGSNPARRGICPGSAGGNLAGFSKVKS